MQKRLIALLGHPVAHSKSPAMQNAAFDALKLAFHYMAFDVSPEHLTEAIDGLKCLGFYGANITVPHKISILPLLDEITPLAKDIGAVNTIFYQNGRLVGDNTDGQGYLASLLQDYPDINLKEMTVGIVGAGGAARAVAFTLAHYGVKKLYITNRHIDKGMELADTLAGITDAVCISREQFQSVSTQLDVLIQTTSVGMSPNIEESVVPMDWLHSHMIVSDLVYNPLETKLLTEARERGARVHTGIGMLVHQGALSFERWTGEKAPVDLMSEVIRGK